MSNDIKPPYEYSREEFYRIIDEFKPSGPCSSQVYNGKKDYQLLSHLERVEFMSFGVHKWLYQKACNGCEESLFKIEYGYNLYEEVIKKHEEETPRREA